MPVVIPFPPTISRVTPARDPIANPWPGDRWTDGRYTRRLVYTHDGRTYYEVPRLVAVRVHGGGTKDVERMSRQLWWLTEKWKAWLSKPETTLEKPGTDPEAPGFSERQLGAIRVVEGTRGSRRVWFEWGDIEIIRAETGYSFTHVITIHGEPFEITGTGTHLLDLGWGIYEGFRAGLSLDEADREAWLAAFESGAGNVVDFRGPE